MCNQHLCELNCASRFFIRYGQEHCGGRGLGKCCTRFPNFHVGFLQTMRTLDRNLEFSSQQSSLCCPAVALRFFFPSIKLLYSNAGGTCFPAKNNGQTLSILTFSLVITRMAGWSQALWYENWHMQNADYACSFFQDICGEERQQAHTLSHQYLRKNFWSSFSKNTDGSDFIDQ